MEQEAAQQPEGAAAAAPAPAANGAAAAPRPPPRPLPASVPAAKRCKNTARQRGYTPAQDEELVKLGPEISRAR